MSDEALAEFGMVLVQPTAKPAEDPAYDVAEGTPAFTGDVLYQVWVSTPVGAGELPARLQQYKRAKLQALRDLRRVKLDADLVVGAKTLDITDELRAQLRELKDYSDANTGATLNVLLPSGKTATVTRAQLLAVHTALANRTKEINDVAVQKADAVAAAATFAAVDAVDLAVGWPA
jgi:type IV pilus biogenesis protein CpaD/CtpE